MAHCISGDNRCRNRPNTHETLTFIDQYVDEIKPMVDEFTRGNLSSDGEWKGHEWIAGFTPHRGSAVAILVRKDLTKGLGLTIGQLLRGYVAWGAMGSTTC